MFLVILCISTLLGVVAGGKLSLLFQLALVIAGAVYNWKQVSFSELGLIVPMAALFCFIMGVIAGNLVFVYMYPDVFVASALSVAKFLKLILVP